jgi:Lrp/AsnC family transcriptional regulator for asnA, asnC and gidA
MIDKIDYRIILELQEDGCIGNAELARRLGISVPSVAKRVDHLLKTDVIAIRAVPNPFKMGHKAKALIALDVNLEKMDDICAKLAEIVYVDLIHTAFGRFDVLMMVNYPTWELLFKFIGEELSRMEGILEVETFFIAEVKKRYEMSFLNDSNNQTPEWIDATDQRLIEELVKNGRADYRYLAEKVQKSISTVSRRISILLEKNIIRIRAIPNPPKLGYEAGAFSALKVDPAKVQEACSELAGYSEIFLIMAMTNGFDILIGAHLPNPQMLHEFIVSKVFHTTGVRNIETFFLGELKKRIYGWYLNDANASW